jgi:hypothetical protein
MQRTMGKTSPRAKQQQAVDIRSDDALLGYKWDLGSLAGE